MMKQIGLLSLFALGLAACKNDTVESEDIRTSGIYARFDVLATGNLKATASAKFTVGHGDTSLVLTGEDELVVSTANAQKTLSRDGEYYRATFDGDDGNTAFGFAFNRGPDDAAAPSSTVTLPDPFTIVVSAAADLVSRAVPLTLTWEASATNDATTWTLQGACLFDSHGIVPDDGVLTIAGTDYHVTPVAEKAASSADDASENCRVTVCIERKRNGTLDPKFANEEGGMIYAVQRRCAEFNSTP